MWKEFGIQWPAVERPWAGEPYNPDPKEITIRLIAIPSQIILDILQACRVKLTTLTPLIHAITLFSLSKNLPQAEATSFTAVTPLNLRPFVGSLKDSTMPPPTRIFGVFLTGVNHEFDRPTVSSIRDAIRSGSETKEAEEAIWKIASKVTTDINNRRQLIPNDDGIGLLPHVSDFHARWKSM